MEEKCETCRFYKGNDGAAAIGICRRYPPKVFLVNMALPSPNILASLPSGRASPQANVQAIPQGVYPPQAAQNWCGEYKLSRALH